METRLRPVILLVLLTSLSGFSQQQAGYRMAGHVVHRENNRPVAGARVSIAPVDHREHEVAVISGSSGEFSFTGLPPGKYTLQVNDHGWVQLYQQLDEFSTAIAVGKGLDSEHVLFVLPAAARINGTVVDEEGDPVRNGMVHLFAESIFRGMVQTGFRSMANTSVNGTFHFGHLPPGTYYVAVKGQPWYAQNALFQMATPDGQIVTQKPDPELDVTFPMTYYAASESASGATALTLAEGGKADISFSLHAVRALHVAIDGFEKAADEQIGATLTQAGPGGALLNMSAISLFQSGNSSRAEVGGVAPGSYVLSVSVSSPKQNRVVGSTNVALTSDTTFNPGDLHNLDSASLSGKVLLEGGVPQALAIWMKNIANGQEAPAFVATDATFKNDRLEPGKYALLLANNPELYMRRVSVKGATYADGILDIGRGADVSLTIDAVPGLTSLSGVVTKDGKPCGGAMVLLVPQDFSHGLFVPRDQSDSDGTFTVNYAAPGPYTLVAISDGRGLAYADAAVIAPFLKLGKTVQMPVSKDFRIEVEVQPRR